MQLHAGDIGGYLEGESRAPGQPIDIVFAGGPPCQGFAESAPATRRTRAMNPPIKNSSAYAGR